MVVSAIHSIPSPCVRFCQEFGWVSRGMSRHVSDLSLFLCLLSFFSLPSLLVQLTQLSAAPIPSQDCLFRPISRTTKRRRSFLAPTSPASVETFPLQPQYFLLLASYLHRHTIIRILLHWPLSTLSLKYYLLIHSPSKSLHFAAALYCASAGVRLALWLA